MIKYLIVGLLSFAVLFPGLVSAVPIALEMDRGKPGEAKPLGWLKAWSRLAADGYAGCMDEVDPEFARAWKAEFRPRGGKLDWMATLRAVRSSSFPTAAPSCTCPSSPCQERWPTAGTPSAAGRLCA